MSICHCLFFKKKNKITVLLKSNSGIEALKFKGDIFIEYTDKFWEDWKNYSGYCNGNVVDFCFIYDTNLDIPDEYKSLQCDVNESIWTVENIKSVSGLLGIVENIKIYDEDNQFVLEIGNFRKSKNEMGLFSNHINKADVINDKKEAKEPTLFIQYFVDKRKGE